MGESLAEVVYANGSLTMVINLLAKSISRSSALTPFKTAFTSSPLTIQAFLPRCSMRVAEQSREEVALIGTSQ